MFNVNDYICLNTDIRREDGLILKTGSEYIISDITMHNGKQLCDLTDEGITIIILLAKI